MRSFIKIKPSRNGEITLSFTEGLDWGSGIHYRLKFSPLFISLKFWVIHLNKTNYLLKERKVVKKYDYSLFINFFLQFIQNIELFINFKALIIHYSFFWANCSLFIIKRAIIH